VVAEIRQVAPIEFSPVASRILTGAWRPPCLSYSAEYLAWQLSFPGELTPKAVAAFSGGEAVGFAAATVRRLDSGQGRFWAYVLSFVGVLPEARGAGAARGLYSVLLPLLHPHPVVAFAEPSSAGERVLVDAFEQSGASVHQLAACRAIGFAPRAYSGELRVVDVPASDGLPVPRDSASQVLCNAPEDEQFAHYMQDPRGRRCVRVEDSSGDPLGWGMAAQVETLTAFAIVRVPMLESLFLSHENAEALRAFVQFASVSGAGSAPAPVFASNLSFVDEPLVKAAGGRSLPSTFNAYLFGADPLITSELRAVNLEVI